MSFNIGRRRAIFKDKELKSKLMEGAMFNFKKICKLMLVAALFCILQINGAYAVAGIPGGGSKTNANGVVDCDPACTGQTECKCFDDMTCRCVAKTPSKTEVTNTPAKTSAVTGCSSNQGIFSGLINTGRKVFNGLRDLIYVVAGFGIIGVAVGGFFGNLNWKWLGAIVISLVVIATTGELISAITGCENFTNAMITDTLK